MNKANSKFATIPGGSRNTVNGRYSFALGAYSVISTEKSGSMSFATTACTPSGDNTLSICGNSVTINGNDVEDLFNARRQLTDAVAEVAKTFGTLEASNMALEKEVADRAEHIEAMTKQLQSFAELQAQHKTLKAKIEHVKALVGAASA